MKISFKKINIESPFPTTHLGSIYQDNLIFNYHDHLFARVLSFKDENQWIIHISFDLLSFKTNDRLLLQEKIRNRLNNSNISLITSATHTHYANASNDSNYIKWLINKVVDEIEKMEYLEYQKVETSYQKLHTKVLGKSRISGYETNNEYLCLIKLFADDVNIISIIINNVHPTILSSNTNYFSSEYPGYILKKLEEEYPNTNFTFLQGAAGDISTRFTRDGQDYDALIRLSDKFIVEIKSLIKIDTKHVPLKLDYKEVILPYEHDFTPIDLSKIRSDLTKREIETIKQGQIERERYLNDTTGETIFSGIIKEVSIASLDIGSVKLIFYPNEIFSEYLNYIDLNKTMLISYSNGYGPYILPIDFKYITYEMFMDTLNKKTKENIIEILKTI